MEFFTLENRSNHHLNIFGKYGTNLQFINTQVTVWDGNGNKCSNSSETSTFETGLLLPSDWKAIWIQRNETFPQNECLLYEDNPVPLFRKDFLVNTQKEVRKIDFLIKLQVVRARAYISGLGLYVLYMDGKKVGENELDVAWTDYNKTILYSTFDITQQIASNSEHAVGVMLGNGM